MYPICPMSVAYLPSICCQPARHQKRHQNLGEQIQNQKWYFDLIHATGGLPSCNKILAEMHLHFGWCMQGLLMLTCSNGIYLRLERIEG